MNDKSLQNVITSQLDQSKKRRIEMGQLQAAVQTSGLLSAYSDFEIQKRLLATLEIMETEKLLKLPSRKGKSTGWSRTTGLPLYVTAIKEKEEQEKKNRQEKIETIRNQTGWESTKMITFAHTLRTLPELERAKIVNEYLKQRKPGTKKIPHRERALRIFGDEKALESYIRSGLFGGKITLDDLDCFYCPEPLPFQSLSMEIEKTTGKPLLLVENANTYWSCCRANQTVKKFAAIVYGQGFSASNAEKSVNGLLTIEQQLKSEGVFYFGDLDPAGLRIPKIMDQYRAEKRLSPIKPAKQLYQALLTNNFTTGYDRSQQKLHDPEWAMQWLGETIATKYLKQVNQYRWPQEGLTADEIEAALRKSL